MASRQPKPLVAGNWKMNGMINSRAEAARLAARLDKARPKPRCEVMICPPVTLLTTLRDTLKGTGVKLGGQDCHPLESGAHTGDTSAEMLANGGAKAVIVGHSERRADHGETDLLVQSKVLAAHRAKLLAIVCVGETETQRDSGQALRVVGTQLKNSLPDGISAANTVIAYEPVWAIGTGRTPTPDDVAKVHQHIRRHLRRRFGAEGEAMRILYGGSVKPANAQELMSVPNVNGALVGGASLKAQDFFGIIKAYIPGA